MKKYLKLPEKNQAQFDKNSLMNIIRLSNSNLIFKNIFKSNGFNRQQSIAKRKFRNKIK